MMCSEMENWSGGGQIIIARFAVAAMFLKIGLTWLARSDKHWDTPRDVNGVA